MMMLWCISVCVGSLWLAAFCVSVWSVEIPLKELWPKKGCSASNVTGVFRFDSYSAV